MADDTPPPPNNPNRGGRPPKLTPERVEAIVQMLYAGNFRSTAARAVGITPRTLARWMRQGKEFPGGIYGSFSRTVTMAEALFETEAVRAIVTAGMEDDPRLLMKFLERRYPQRWSKHRAELVEIRRMMRETEDKLRELEKAMSGLQPAAQ